MSRRTTVLSAVTIVAALWLSGCAHKAADSLATSASSSASAMAEAAPQSAPLPDPAVLIDLLARLADPGVPGPEKLVLVQGATPADAGTLDRFTKALADNHMIPLIFAATDVAWSEQEPGNVVASVTATGPDPKAGGFSFPMEFAPFGAGWQLSRHTADMLLVFGDSPVGPMPPTPEPPAPEPPAPEPAAPTPTP